MNMKGIFFGLMRACTSLVSGIGSAAVDVLRHANFQESEETDLERYTRETRDFCTKSPNGDGRYDLDPNGVRDSL